MTKPLHVHVQLKGEYRIVLNQGTDRETDTGWFDNLVTNQGLDRLGSTVTPNCFTYTSIGTGTNAPANTDTALQAYVAQATGKVVDERINLGASTYAARTTMHWVYAQGAVVGNMAEVGVGWTISGTGLFSRARIVDGAGTPTTLTCTSLDQLTVYYRITCTPTITDTVSTVVISGTTYNYTARLSASASFFTPNTDFMWDGDARWGTITQCWVYPAGCTIGALTGNPSGTQTAATASSISLAAYTTGNYYNDCTFSFAPSTANPAGGIQGLKLSFGNSGGAWQYVFTAAIPKDSTKTLTLTVRYSWGR